MVEVPRRDLEDCDDDIAKGYLKTAAQHLAKMEAAVRSKSMPNIQQLSHRLAGTSAYLGLTVMANLLRGLERAASEGRSEKARQFLASLQDEFSRLQRHMTTYFLKVETSLPVSRQSAGKKKFKIMIVDDHPLLREGLKRLIELEPEFHVCGEAATARQALVAIPVLQPDMVILDIARGDTDAVNLIKCVQRRRSPPPRILALSMHDESLYAEQALRAGAKGYLMKHDAAKDVIKAMHRILAGKVYLS
jgi:CheY-like chemotaxis protein